MINFLRRDSSSLSWACTINCSQLYVCSFSVNLNCLIAPEGIFTLVSIQTSWYTNISKFQFKLLMKKSLPSCEKLYHVQPLFEMKRIKLSLQWRKHNTTLAYDDIEDIFLIHCGKTSEILNTTAWVRLKPRRLFRPVKR